MSMCVTCGETREKHDSIDCHVCGRTVCIMDAEACGDCDNHVCDQHPVNGCSGCDIAKCDKCWTSDNDTKPAEVDGEEVCGVCIDGRGA